jgi:hypothetical protein
MNLQSIWGRDQGGCGNNEGAYQSPDVSVAADRRAEGWDQPVGGYQQMLLNPLDLLPMA